MPLIVFSLVSELGYEYNQSHFLNIGRNIITSFIKRTGGKPEKIPHIENGETMLVYSYPDTFKKAMTRIIYRYCKKYHIQKSTLEPIKAVPIKKKRIFRKISS